MAAPPIAIPAMAPVERLVPEEDVADVPDAVGVPVVDGAADAVDDGYEPVRQ